jgi:hypothetical protein
MLSTTRVGLGLGLAVSLDLGVLVVSDSDANTLCVFALPSTLASSGGAAGPNSEGLRLKYSLGGPSSEPPLVFRFVMGGAQGGGCLAFLPALAPVPGPGEAGRAHGPLLVVTDAGADAVHLVDVRRRAHAGYVAPPGSIMRPGGVAVSPSGGLVAVSGSTLDLNPYGVKLYAWCATGWEYQREVGRGFGAEDGQMYGPRGLRFSGDGALVCVADTLANRVSVYRVGDGAFVRHLVTGLRMPRDVEECEGGWLVVHGGGGGLVWVPVAALDTVTDLGGRGPWEASSNGAGGSGPRGRGAPMQPVQVPWDLREWAGPGSEPGAGELVPGAVALAVAAPGAGVVVVRDDVGRRVRALQAPLGGWGQGWIASGAGGGGGV